MERQESTVSVDSETVCETLREVAEFVKKLSTSDNSADAAVHKKLSEGNPCITAIQPCTQATKMLFQLCGYKNRSLHASSKAFAMCSPNHLSSARRQTNW